MADSQFVCEKVVVDGDYWLVQYANTKQEHKLRAEVLQYLRSGDHVVTTEPHPVQGVTGDPVVAWSDLGESGCIYGAGAPDNEEDDDEDEVGDFVLTLTFRGVHRSEVEHIAEDCCNSGDEPASEFDIERIDSD